MDWAHSGNARRMSMGKRRIAISSIAAGGTRNRERQNPRKIPLSGITKFFSL
jgi:hypothetical protein